MVQQVKITYCEILRLEIQIPAPMWQVWHPAHTCNPSLIGTDPGWLLGLAGFQSS